MKKIFTLVSMAVFAVAVNAQDSTPQGEVGLYEVKEATWKDITWKNGNNKKDNDNNDMLFLMGTGNGQVRLMAEYYQSSSDDKYYTRAAYTYVDYEGGETGVPSTGLYYKFTPKVDGALKFNTWVNKGNRKTFVVKASDGKVLEPYVDYSFEGYVNGQNETKIIGEKEVNVPKFFTGAEIKQRVDEENAKLAAESKDPINKFVIEKGNQAVWGWINLNVTANESYYIYQQSSQLGFGGYTFTPNNGVAEDYVAVVDMGEPTGKVLAPEFANVIDANGVATNVADARSIVKFSTTNMSVEACGAAVPNTVVADFTKPSGIETVKAAEVKANAAMFNLAGQQVNGAFKGMVIQNGKKFIVK